MTQWHVGVCRGRSLSFADSKYASEVAFSDIEYVWSVIQWCLLNTLSATLDWTIGSSERGRRKFLDKQGLRNVSRTEGTRCMRMVLKHLMALQFMTYPALQICRRSYIICHMAMPCHLTRHEKCVMRGRYDVHVDEVGFTSSPAVALQFMTCTIANRRSNIACHANVI